ncbi:MAG: T9SS type A sorting domain-containing protein, partial [Cytophagales bacterium]|nr:T9SS type A sorting domain-containing protein [Cytophagales bacterium]
LQCEIRKKIEVAANNEAYGQVTGGGNYLPGSKITISATPNNGYFLKAWKEKEAIVSNNSSFKVTVGRQDRQFVAVFKPNIYTLNLESGNGGSLSADKKLYVYMDKALINIQPEAGFTVQKALFNKNDVTSQLKQKGENWTFETPELTADGTLSVRFAQLLNAEEELTVQIAPNPVQDELRVSNLPEGARLFVMDLSNRLLQTVIAKGSAQTLDFSRYPAGIYILKVEGGKTFKVVKR